MRHRRAARGANERTRARIGESRPSALPNPRFGVSSSTMPEANPHPLLDVFARERCSAILRTPVAEAVAPAMRAAVEGGFRIIEFTLNTPDALAHIEAFARHEDLVVGAGTVLDTALAEAAVA